MSLPPMRNFSSPDSSREPCPFSLRNIIRGPLIANPPPSQVRPLGWNWSDSLLTCLFAYGGILGRGLFGSLGDELTRSAN